MHALGSFRREAPGVPDSSFHSLPGYQSSLNVHGPHARVMSSYQEHSLDRKAAAGSAQTEDRSCKGGGRGALSQPCPAR